MLRWALPGPNELALVIDTTRETLTEGVLILSRRILDVPSSCLAVGVLHYPDYPLGTTQDTNSGSEGEIT